ncbi:MAG: GntR family transcriptional regulator [Fusicatenibacter sp.]|nr:GntR family transcriptional regulator [Fusicatenibacter sp.]
MSRDPKSRPMYEQIENDIIQKIQTGVYQEGDRIPSEQELIDTWKVSRTTATKALTELSLEGYIYRIQGKGSFANPLGSHIAPGQYPQTHVKTDSDSDLPHKIGVIIPESYDYHSGNIIKGIRETLPFPSYFVDITHSSNRREEEYALNYFLETSHSGIILFPTNYEFYSDIILQMTLKKYPLVLIDRIFPGIHCMSVTCDNAMGCELAVSHLTSLGHRDIAFVSDEPYKEQVTQLRCNSYLGSMSVRGLTGISYEDFFCSADAASMHSDFVARVMAGKLTAVIASNAHAALSLYQLCMEHSIRIPEDLSVVCFDNPNFYLQPTGNFFTYLEQNSFDMGCQAALLLHQVLSEKKTPDDPQIVLEPRLMEHASTCSPVKKPTHK